MYDFDGSNGSKPYGKLLQASDGKLYGMTYQGGSNNVGVIFSFDPVSLDYIKHPEILIMPMEWPFHCSTFIEVPDAGPLPVTLISFTGKNNGNSNQLSWKVGNEQNLNYYELQRGPDGQNFKAISQIKAVGNNSYTYNDHHSCNRSFNILLSFKKCR